MQRHFVSSHGRKGIGWIAGALLAALLGAYLTGCGGGSDSQSPVTNRTMLVLGSTSQPEFASLKQAYGAVTATGTSDDPTRHALVAVGCNGFTPESLANNAVLRHAFAHQIPVTFFDMTESHKKALMLPRMGVATSGTSPAVLMIPGAYASLTKPGIIIESKTLVSATKKTSVGKVKKATPGVAEAAAASIDSSADRNPALFVEKVQSAISGRLLSRAVGDDASDGIYTIPTGVKYYSVLLYGGGTPTLQLKTTQQMSLSAAWRITVFDDLGNNATSLGRKILVTTVGQSQAKTTEHWAEDKNGLGADADLGYWLGAVQQSVYVSDDTTSLITSSPNTTQNSTTYTSSVSQSIGFELSDETAVNDVESFSMGSSTTTNIQQWIALQTVRVDSGSANYRIGAVNHWVQNQPFNQFVLNNDSNTDNINGFFIQNTSNKHLGDLPDYSSGKAVLYTKSAAIFAVPANTQLAQLNPVYVASLFRYYQTANFEDHLERVDFTYSPGILLIDTDAVDKAVGIASITFDSAPSGIWSVPFGKAASGTVTVRLSKAAAENTTVTLTHSVDTVFPDPVGISWTTNPEPNGAATTVNIQKGQSSAIIPIYATASTAGSNSGKQSFFATIVGSVDGQLGQETTGKTLLRSQ